MGGGGPNTDWKSQISTGPDWVPFLGSGNRTVRSLFGMIQTQTVLLARL